MQGLESVEAGRACEHIEGNTTTSRPKEGLGARDGAQPLVQRGHGP